MTAKEWWRRMQTLNRYLRYFLDATTLKRYFPESDFRDWWRKGEFGTEQLKRNCVNQGARNVATSVEESRCGKQNSK
jgi:5-methylcytosine-specific restriction endonuclease McrBC GTP-binding regulatory subunit McrB